jgi:hypothetical protein
MLQDMLEKLCPVPDTVIAHLKRIAVPLVASMKTATKRLEQNLKGENMVQSFLFQGIPVRFKEIILCVIFCGKISTMLPP